MHFQDDTYTFEVAGFFELADDENEIPVLMHGGKFLEKLFCIKIPEIKAKYLKTPENQSPNYNTV